MTREEAVTVLKAFMKNPLFSDEHKAAFNIAIHDIKAHHDWDINNLILINKDNYEPLEQEPTTKNDLAVDCISRESVLKLIYDYKENHSNDREHYPINYGTLLDMCRWVRKLPSVTPQPCEDTISRVDAINCLVGQIELNPSDVPAVNEYLKGVDKRLHELSSVTPQSRWIPVSERLPEEDTDVLVTLKCGLIGIMQKKLADDDYGEPCYIWQDFEGEEHEVIAWMPLPAPYKADRSEEE